MKIVEIIYDIREAVKEYTNDSELDDRYIIHLVNIKRSKFLRQQLEKFGKKFSNSDLQSLCLEVEEISTNECGLDLGCDKIVRTKEPLPELLELNTRNSISRVSSSDRLSSSFSIIERERATHYLSSIFNRKIKSFLNYDNHLYFISKSPIMLECITITGIFHNPLELSNYKNCCDCEDDSSKCYDYFESEYPIQPHLYDLIRSEVINDILRQKSIPEDIVNNEKDDK